MNKYALILLELFTEEILNGVVYPVCIDSGKWKLLEYTTEDNPTGEDWIIFEGEDSNVKCADYLNNQ